MKKYKFAFSPILIALLIVLITISLLGTAINLARYFNPILKSFKTARPIIFAVLSLALFVLALLTIFLSRYEFKNGELYFFVGFIKFKLGAKEVTLVKEYKDKNLVLVFNDAKFTVVLIKPQNFSAFISELKEINSKFIHESVEQ